MTQYTDYNGNVLTSVPSGWNGRDTYREQADKELKTTGTFTPLPLSKDFDGTFNWNIFGEGGWRREPDEIARDSQIMKGVLQESFKSDDPEYLSKLITTYGYYYPDHSEPQKQNLFIQTVRDTTTQKLSENPDWANNFSAEAKLAILALNGDNHHFLQKISQNAEFMDIKLPEGSRSSNFATLLTAKIYTPKPSQPHYTEYVPWNIKAMALRYNRTHNSKIKTTDVLQDLVKNSHNNGLDRNTTVKTLSEIIETHSWQRSDSSNRELSYEIKNYLYENAANLPACEETGKLFTTLMTSYQMYSNSFKIKPDSINYPAFQEAIKQKNLQDEANRSLQDIEKIEKGFADKKFFNDKIQNADLRDFNIENIAKHNPEFIEKNYQKISSEILYKIITNPDLEFSKQATLRMMTHFVTQTDNTTDRALTKLTTIAQKAETLQSSSKEATALADVLKEKFLEHETKLNGYVDKITNAKQLEAQKQQADAEYAKSSDAKQMFMTILAERKKLKEHKINNGKKKPIFSEEMIDKALADALEGKTSGLQYTPSKGLKRLFMSKKQKLAELDLAGKVAEFNKMLPQISAHKEVLKTLNGPLNDNTYQKEFLPQHYAKDKATDIYIPNYKYEQEIVAEYQVAKNTIETFQTNTAQRQEEMLGKARTDLSMKFHQEFDGKPLAGLKEEDRRAGEIYKSKAEELRSKISQAAKDDMERRGVNKKPEISKTDNSGKPMDEQSKNISKMIKDQKLYNHLADQRSK